jgi:hypothetical protein
VHVAFSRSAGSAHPKLIKGVRHGQQGQRLSGYRGLSKGGLGPRHQPKVKMSGYACCSNFGSHPPDSRKWETWELYCCIKPHERAGLFISRLTLSKVALPDSWSVHQTTLSCAQHHVPAIFLCENGFGLKWWHALVREFTRPQLAGAAGWPCARGKPWKGIWLVAAVSSWKTAAAQCTGKPRVVLVPGRKSWVR